MVKELIHDPIFLTRIYDLHNKWIEDSKKYAKPKKHLNASDKRKLDEKMKLKRTEI